jgi:CO/xanthine dehydrogenase FAD-binding subunit
MDLHTITDVKRPTSLQDVPPWRDGYAWLAGGTWLFSEPQVALDTLIDLQSLKWENLVASAEGLDIAATCPIGVVDVYRGPPEWRAVPLLSECAHSLLMSFKIADVATIGGNICMSLPAGAMISLTTSLEGIFTLLAPDGSTRTVDAIDFVTGVHANVLQRGELLRSIRLPASALSKRFAFRRASLTHLGRSAALLVGTQTQGADDLLLTITAAVPRPVQIRFAHMPSANDLRSAIAARIEGGDGWFDDVHGSAPYKRHVTYHFAEQIRSELSQPEAAQ